MRTLRSASREDEVVVPSERQRSLRSTSNSPPRKRPRDGFSTPDRPNEDDEIEVPPAPKKRVSSSSKAFSSTKHAAKKSVNRFHLGAGQLAKTTSDAADGADAASYPSPDASCESGSRVDSPESTMTAKEKTNATSIYDLPIEVIQNIMAHLPDDKDVVSVAQTGKAINRCYTRSIFVMRFAQNFDALDLPRFEDESYNHYNSRVLDSKYEQYIKRQALTRREVSFSQWGKSAMRSQDACVNSLFSIILTSNASLVRSNVGGKERIFGLNHEWLLKYFKLEGTPDHKVGTNFLGYVVTGRKVPHYAATRARKVIQRDVALKLCLTHLMLNPRIPQIQSRFVDSQSTVYTCIRRAPLFKGKGGFDVNFEWLEHAANFFKYHFRQQNGEGLLTHLIEDLPEKDLPRAWPGVLQNGTKKLGPKWKGAFTYIGEDAQLAALRNGTLEDSAEDETSEDNDGFQDLAIFNDIAEHEDMQFPDSFEEELHGKPKGQYFDSTTCKAIDPGYKDFFGLGKAKTDYHLFGRMHSLPSQAGIPGWQRVTMMKVMPEEGTKTYGNNLTAVWAYEGVVLPGGQIIIGRWWSPFHNGGVGTSYCGPFIFWQVSSEVEQNNTHLALEFLEVVKAATV